MLAKAIPANSHALARLRVENFDLTPAHACGPISHAWSKNVSCCRLAWHNFQKYVNSDPCKERKPCVKWINDNTFLAIYDFWNEKHWVWACVYTRPKTGTGKCEGCFCMARREMIFPNLAKSRQNLICRLSLFYFSKSVWQNVCLERVQIIRSIYSHIAQKAR